MILAEGDLITLCAWSKYRPIVYGIVTGFSKTGWVFITWSNGVVGQWPYHKIELVARRKP